MRKSTMGGIIALLCAGILTLTAGIGSSWFTNGDIKTWFNSWGKGKQEIVQPETPNDSDVTTTDGNNMIATPTSGKLMRMSVMPLMETDDDGIATVAEDSCVLIASNDSGDSSLEEYIWSAKFENASSTWANGKNVTDYLSISTSADTKQQTIRAKQAYGEPIIITVASKVNSDATATCKFDYVKRITDVTLKINDDNVFVLGQVNSYNLAPSYSIGTVTGDISVDTVSVSLSSKVDSDVTSALGSAYGYCQIYSPLIISAGSPVSPFDFLCIPAGGGQTEIQASNWGKLAYNAILNDAAQSFGMKDIFYLSVKTAYSYNYNGTTYQSGETSLINVSFDKGSLTKYTVVSSVNLNQNNYAF